jgi:hypothetical protein
MPTTVAVFKVRRGDYAESLPTGALIDGAKK